MIELKQVSKQFGHKKIFTDINLQIHEGEFISLVGANGAGKTTLLRILAGLSQPSAGSIQICGYILPAQAASARRFIAYLGHKPALYGDLTAEENLRFFCGIYNSHTTPQKMTAMLEQIELLEQADDLVRTFSHGMKQRLCLAIVLLGNPRLILLDEPFTGLDENGQVFLQTRLLELHQAGHTIIMASHDKQRVREFSDRVVQLENRKANWLNTVPLSAMADSGDGAQP